LARKAQDQFVAVSFLKLITPILDLADVFFDSSKSSVA